MQTVIEVTDHAFNRLRERSGINRKAAVRLSERAYKDGLKHNEVSGDVFKYMSSVATKSNRGCSLRLYGDKVFIFNKSSKNNEIITDNEGNRVIKLITIVQIPTNLIKKVNIQMEKKRERA